MIPVLRHRQIISDLCPVTALQEVLGIDGRPEEWAVIIGNWFSTWGIVQLIRSLPVTREAAGWSLVASAILTRSWAASPQISTG